MIREISLILAAIALPINIFSHMNGLDYGWLVAAIWCLTFIVTNITE